MERRPHHVGLFDDMSILLPVMPRYLDYEEIPEGSSRAEGVGAGEEYRAHTGYTSLKDELPRAVGEASCYQRPCTRLARVVDGWLTLLPDASRAWARLEQFLELMEGIGYMGDRERDLLLNRRMVCRLSDFFLQVSVARLPAMAMMEWNEIA